MPAAIRLIVNADDLGWTEGVNAGVFRAHREGMVSSTTLAANMPAAEQALGELANLPNLGVGVHLNACQGPALSRQGRQILAGPRGVMDRTGGQVLRACLLRPARMLPAIEAEFDAQIDWCLRHRLHPTHADSHRHLHAWPPVFRLVAGLCRRYDIRFVRRPLEMLGGAAFPPARTRRRLLSKLVNLMGRRCHALAPERFATTGTLGLAHTGLIEAGFLLAALESLQPGVTEIMVHPGYAAGLSFAQTRLLASRQIEMEALCDAQVLGRLKERKVELTHYGRLTISPATASQGCS
jgi:predicted glycoside hydrolase/deacetylase ChbG (UPF0249 family)